MHIIELNQTVSEPFDRLYVAAVAKVMGVNIPCKIKLIAHGTTRIYDISSFGAEGVKIEKPGV